jgi:C4-dicarboxylate-binding protein DctP
VEDNVKGLFRIATVLGAGLLAAAMALPVSAASIKFVMSNDNNGVGLKGKTFEVLKKEVEKRLVDKVTVELHHSGTLFDQKTQIQGLQLGGADLIAPTQGIYAPLSPNINVLSLPFLLSTPEAVQAAIDEPTIHKAIFSDLEKKNILPLAVWINGPRDFSYKGSKPILVPADLHGIKIRVQPVKVDLETWKTLGANVVGMSWSEVPTALQQGVIEAVEPTPNALVGAGLGEMIDYVTRLDYHYSFYIVSTNKQWWEKLPADVRSGIQDALNAATKWNWENGTKENEAAYDKVRKLGKKIETLTPEQRAKWADAVKPVWKQYGEKQVGADVMKRLTEIADKHR